MCIHGGKKMNKTVEKGKTLLVDGPASVTLLSGKVDVFGFQLGGVRKIIIREGKRLPFTVQEQASFDLALGADASVEEKEGSTIPPSWLAAYDALREIQKKPVVVLVVGGVDSGKTSFCTYLINRLVTEKFRVAILDEDLGQSDIGPPGTVAYAYVVKPVTDLFNLKPENLVFVGATSPSRAADKTVDAAASLKTEIAGKGNADFIVVNTDGWAISEEAIQFKSRLATALEPDVVFCLQNQNSIPSLCATLGDALAGFRQEVADSPIDVRERNRESRRNLRELGFAKYLENAKVKVFPLNYITVEGIEKNAFIRQRTAGNLLLALYDKQKRFLGIGVMRSVDYERKALKIQTSVSEKPVFVVLGKTRLDENLREIPEKMAQ
jgi:polynucleotide 5'-hydroxyl-kinase GRC3/NOL9